MVRAQAAARRGAAGSVLGGQLPGPADGGVTV
jgi:hypothetical protein